MILWLVLWCASLQGSILDLFAYHEDTGAGGLVDGLMRNVLMVELQNRLAVTNINRGM